MRVHGTSVHDQPVMYQSNIRLFISICTHICQICLICQLDICGDDVLHVELNSGLGNIFFLLSLPPKYQFMLMWCICATRSHYTAIYFKKHRDIRNKTLFCGRAYTTLKHFIFPHFSRLRRAAHFKNFLFLCASF